MFQFVGRAAATDRISDRPATPTPEVTLTFDVHQLDSFVLVGAAVTLLAILAVRVSSRAGLPSLLIYLLMGVALGESGVGIQFEDAELAHALGFLALAVILAEGGLTTSWTEVKSVDAARGRAGHHRRRGLGGRDGASPPTTCSACRGSWPCCWAPSRSPTDAAAVFSVLRVLPLPKRLTGTLEAESGLNDAPTVVLVTLISTGAVADHGVLGDGRHRRLRARRRRRLRAAVRVRRRLGDAPGRAAVLGPLPARGPHPDLPRLRRRPAPSTGPASPRCTSPRWCSATASSRTARPPGRSPRASPGWPRSGSS